MGTILIIDDDEDYGELTRQRLKIAGYDVQFHLGPFGSVNAVRRSEPRLVILDVQMPGLSGAGLIDLIRARPAGKPILVLLNSNLDVDQLATIAARHGADDWISKSASRDQLVAKVRAMLCVEE